MKLIKKLNIPCDYVQSLSIPIPVQSALVMKKSSTIPSPSLFKNTFRKVCGDGRKGLRTNNSYGCGKRAIIHK